MAKYLNYIVVSTVALSAASAVRADTPQDLRVIYDSAVRRTNAVEFPQVVAGDPVAGQRKFGFAADGVTLDSSEALFQGQSIIAGNVVSNGRTCATCHRAGDAFLGMPAIPVTQNVPADDPLLTGIAADTEGDPLALGILDEYGLIKYRPGRFNPTFADNDPFRQVFFWRKSIRLVNTVFLFGFLGDGRMRDLTETSRGAIFSHTQEGDVRFDDLANPPLHDISAFIETQISPPELKALLNPADPLYETLVNDPFYTVPVTTPLERRGQEVFEHKCMTCHNMPNVFGNLDHQMGPPLNLAPPFGHSMDVGVAQQNLNKLAFTQYDPSTGTRFTVVLPLLREDGTTINYTVVDDPGLAAATGRFEDLHRFKVPQLRNISKLGPYFHDDSEATLADVVDYFNSDAYNTSADGRKSPIHMNHEERSALLAFLNIL